MNRHLAIGIGAAVGSVVTGWAIKQRIPKDFATLIGAAAGSIVVAALA